MTHATITALTPMLRTWDLRASIAFYTQVLGFSCEVLDEGLGWAALSWGGVSLMLSGPNAHEGDQKPAFTGSLYLQTHDLDALWLAVKDSARVCYAPENFDYGMREFAIYDNNGYLLQFGQTMEPAG